MYNEKVKKLYSFVVAIILIEFVLGGLGHLFGLPVRNVLFLVGILFSVYIIYVEKIKIRKVFLFPIIVVVVYAIYGSVIGLVRGNPLGAIFSDANSFLGILNILLLTAYINEDDNKINNVFSIFINSSVVVAIITISLFVISRIYLPNDLNIINIYNDLNDKLQYGLISGLVLSNNYARVYLFNGIFMQLATALLIVKMFNKESSSRNKIYDYIRLSLLIIGIYVSSTRGFWIGTLGVFIVAIMYFVFRVRKDKLTVENLIIPILALILVAIIIPKTIVEPSIDIPPTSESIKDRVESIVDFEGDPSNKIRKVQLEFLLKEFSEEPILGAGFGASIPEFSQYMIDNNLPQRGSTNFELYYVELLFKTGIIGISIFFGYLLYNFVKLTRLIFLTKMNKKDEQLLVGWTIGTLSILASTITNPYIASLAVFFVLVFEVYLIQLYGKRYLN